MVFLKVSIYNKSIYFCISLCCQSGIKRQENVNFINFSKKAISTQTLLEGEFFFRLFQDLMSVSGLFKEQ